MIVVERPGSDEVYEEEEEDVGDDDSGHRIEYEYGEERDVISEEEGPPPYHVLFGTDTSEDIASRYELRTACVDYWQV